MKNKYLGLFLLFSFGTTIYAQGVGINENGTSPNPSAILDVNSTTKGFLPPRLSDEQRNSIANPAEGLTIYNTNTKCLQWFDGTGWIDACSGKLYVSNNCNPSKPTSIVEVLNPITNKIWMDRNLGANRAATSFNDSQSYGSLFQWGRGSDGHQCVYRFAGDGVTNSATTSTLSTTNSPGHGQFIITNMSPIDWRSPQNDNLWIGVNGTNNPCPTGYRLPTESELDAERLSWISSNSAGAFASPLKFSVAGFRNYENGGFGNIGSFGAYWSSNVNGTKSRLLYFGSSVSGISSDFRAYGFSVRCIKN